MTTGDKSLREIRKIAYDVWMRDGQPPGRDCEPWETAMEIWASRSHDDPSPDDTADAAQQNAVIPESREDMR